MRVSSPIILLLLCCITDVVGMNSFDSVTGLDVTFTSSEIEEVESAAHTLFEVVSWMDWWLCSTTAMILEQHTDEDKSCSLFFAEARMQMIVIRIPAKTILKQHDAVLVKVKGNSDFFEVCMERHYYSSKNPATHPS